MPTYNLKDTKNNTEFEVICSWAELQIMLAEMPELSNPPSSPRIVSGVKGLNSRVPSGFKDVLSRVKGGAGKANSIKTHR